MPGTLLKILWNKAKTFLLCPHKREIKSLPNQSSYASCKRMMGLCSSWHFRHCQRLGSRWQGCDWVRYYCDFSLCATHSSLPSQSWCSDVAENTQGAKLDPNTQIMCGLRFIVSFFCASLLSAVVVNYGWALLFFSNRPSDQEMASLPTSLHPIPAQSTNQHRTE